MNSDAIKCSLVGIELALVSVIIACLIVPSTPISPHGVFLPVAPSGTPLSACQVSFYNPATTPCMYKKLGYINVQFYSKEVSTSGEAQLQQYVREIAAKTGANGVIVTFFGHTISGAVRKALSSYIFIGTAIYVCPEYLK
ncbi:hypothetical protein [Coxiella endosymbiont of Amblyomma nuttalli]|uniref:hypothetical protein n=1 Tax=Coxiella endosymbiont of Amblyomma nuttalli TaxID=2749996 RepID=UPI001BAD4316|nr:hypothetical protein [Coxiella endosymbiont of Amblyomma nuttalli]QTS83946.1 hypothetical protein CEAn_00428 [Coxiella endosymbiont of Amblyomma nuttalli]